MWIRYGGDGDDDDNSVDPDKSNLPDDIGEQIGETDSQKKDDTQAL